MSAWSSRGDWGRGVEELRGALGGGGFTDGTVTPGATAVRAQHVTELRTAIDVVRTLLGLPAFAWTDRVLTRGSTPVRRVHFTELRTALAHAYQASGRPPPLFAESLVTSATPVRATHLADLRAALRALSAPTTVIGWTAPGSPRMVGDTRYPWRLVALRGDRGFSIPRALE